jgi:hypothetical protein
MVGGPGGILSSASTADSAQPMATSETEAREILAEALELADEDIVGAHRMLKRIPETSPVYESDDFRALEDRWADAMFKKADETQDRAEKRSILNEISETSSVSADKRKRAAELAAEIPPDETAGAPPTRQQGAGAGPYTPPPVPGDPYDVTSAPSTTPSTSSSADERFNEQRQKQGLYSKMASGRATEDELRMLKAICMNDGDRACRNMAVAELQKKREEKKPK